MTESPKNRGVSRQSVTWSIAAVIAAALGFAVLGPGALKQPTAPADTESPNQVAFEGPPPIDPLPWRGVRWNTVKAAGLALPAGGHVAGLTVAPGGGLLAYGQGPRPAGPPDPNGLTTTGTIWRSVDAVTWHAVPILGGVPNGSVSEVRTVAAGPQGILAVGGVCCGVEEPAAWWSRDGLAWRRVAFPLPIGGGPIAAAAGPAGFVVVGTQGVDGAIWTSPDGIDWASVGDAAGLGVGELDYAAATPDGFVVVGHLDPRAADSDGAIWASRGLDGWHRVAAADPSLVGDDEVALQRILTYAGGMFVTGGVGKRADRIRCEQLLGGAPAAGPIDVALSCGWLREMNWRSDDGATWERIDPWGKDGAYPPEFVGPPPGRAPASWELVVAGGPGLVALPYELVGGEPTSGGNEVGVWVSVNGRAWERVAAGPGLGVEGVAGWSVLGRRIAIVTMDGSVIVGTVLP